MIEDFGVTVAFVYLLVLIAAILAAVLAGPGTKNRA